MEQAPTGGGAGARVLVVDDDPTVAEIVTGYLDRAGYVVDRAGDGPDALARAAAHRPDLVVLDLMLPGMDGLEVCRRMRGQGPVPVIMLTARGDEDDRILGLEVGADDYVTKPFSPRSWCCGWGRCCGGRGRWRTRPPVPMCWGQRGSSLIPGLGRPSGTASNLL